MAQEQTSYAGDDIKVLVNVIGSTGAHVAAVINTTTTRLNGLSAAPTVTTVATGIYQIVFSGVTPAPAEGDRYACKINGTISGVAWSEYGIPVKIVADERGTDNADKTLFQFPSTAATANTVSSVVTVSPLIISAKKVFIHLRYSSTVDNTPDANSHREIALQPPTPVNTSTAPSEINLKTYFGADNRYSISNEISSAEVDITSLGLEVLHGDWTIIVRDNQGMGYNQQVHGASIEFSSLPVTIGDATAASQTSISSAISSLNDFNPATDAVANVTLVATTTTNSDMRGTDGANTTTPNTVAPDNASIANILADTNELQANQGDWLTATGFNTIAPDNASIAAILVDTADLQANQSQWITATGFATVNPDNASIAAIKAKTDQLAFTVSNQVDSNAITGGGGDDAATIYGYFTGSNRQDTFRATGFNTIAPDNASIALILADTNELQTNQDDWLTATGFATVNPDNASIALVLADTNELQANQGDWETATGFATVNADNAGIAAIKAKTDSLTFSVANQVDANAVTGGGQPIGSGAISHTITVNIDGNPAAAVDAWVTTDAAGSSVVAGTLVTDNAGQVTFQLDAGSYYLWCQRSGVNFSNPTAFTVS